MNALKLMSTLAVLTLLIACGNTTVTFLTQAPPGRIATVDVQSETLLISRGLAVAFDCVEWDDSYSGPCRDMAVTLGDDAIGENIPAHLDAFAGQNVYSQSDDELTVGGPTDRQGGVVLALAEGETTLTITTAGGSVEMGLVVSAPPAQDE